MVHISVNCLCTKCGQPFVYEKDCPNQMEAAKLEKWAAKKKNVCPECWKKEKALEAEERAERLSLPKIQGISEKQVAFAELLRKLYIEKNKELMDYAKVQLDKVNPEKIPPTARKHHIRADRCVAVAFHRAGLWKAYVCLTETDARNVIDTLK